ncbi:Complement C3, partial [Dissostichus eleginoides]
MGPVHDVPSDTAQPAEEQHDLHYSSIRFPQNQEDALYSNIGRVQPHRQTEEEEDMVEYTAVKTPGEFNNISEYHQDDSGGLDADSCVSPESVDELDSGFMCENFSETAAETEDTESRKTWCEVQSDTHLMEKKDISLRRGRLCRMLKRIGGGFGSTQSTMVVLQALSEYLIHKPPPADLSLDVDVRLRGRKEIRYHFNPENSYAARSSRLHAGMDLEVQAQGNGQGILEVVTYYNQLHEVDEKIPCKDFELKVNIEESNETPPVDVQKSYQITIKVRALGPTDVRMVVLDISLPTGFTPENSDLEMLSNAVDSYINDFKIVDNLSDRGSLIIHLFKVSHKEPEILIFRLQQRFKVGLLQPSSVTVYEYYNPDHRCTHTYTPREDREELTQICKDNVCRCTQGDCERETFACTTLNHVLQVKVLNVTQSYYDKYEMEITKVIKL